METLSSSSACQFTNCTRLFEISYPRYGATAHEDKALPHRLDQSERVREIVAEGVYTSVDDLLAPRRCYAPGGGIGSSLRGSPLESERKALLAMRRMQKAGKSLRTIAFAMQERGLAISQVKKAFTRVGETA